MKRGEVYWADLVPCSGSEQQGQRPVIVGTLERPLLGYCAALIALRVPTVAH